MQQQQQRRHGQLELVLLDRGQAATGQQRLAVVACYYVSAVGHQRYWSSEPTIDLLLLLLLLLLLASDINVARSAAGAIWLNTKTDTNISTYTYVLGNCFIDRRWSRCCCDC